MAKLNPDQITVSMATVPDWKREGPGIFRTYTLSDFTAAIDFVNVVAKAAQKANHHPDIEVKWNQVTLRMTSHSEGGLTDKDFAMASKFDHLVP
jgi:4a-hydroxytetrahydrobiopterin dehydratase